MNKKSICIEKTLKHFSYEEGFSLPSDTYQLIYIIRGDGMMTIDGKSTRTLNNQLFLIHPNQTYTLFNNLASDGFTISLAEEIWQELPLKVRQLQFTLFSPLSPFNQIDVSGESNEIHPWLEKLYNEFKLTPCTNQFHLVVSYLKIILIKAGNLQKKQALKMHNSINDYLIFTSFLEAVEQMFVVLTRSAEYAAKLNTSEKQLSKSLKHFTGLTTRKLIDKRLLIEAKYLLKYTWQPIDKISDRLGFANQVKFSKYLKKHTGYSPELFRLS